MWLKPITPFLLVPLLCIMAVQAAPNEPPAPGKGAVVSVPVPKPQLRGKTNVKGTGNRYGVGYEARHGIDAAGARSDRVDRVDRVERLERIERPDRMERDDRGR